MHNVKLIRVLLKYELVVRTRVLILLLYYVHTSVLFLKCILCIIRI